jgi:hypothetical protein
MYVGGKERVEGNSPPKSRVSDCERKARTVLPAVGSHHFTQSDALTLNNDDSLECWTLQWK